MNRTRILSGLAAALALLMVPACQRGPSRPRVAFVTNNPGAFWSIAEAGANAAAAEEDVELLFRKPGQTDVGLQKEAIDDVLSQGIKAIAVSVIDPENQRDFLSKLAARVPLLTQDNDAPATQRLCYIGTNNYEAGKAVGKLVEEAMPRGGTIAVFVGDIKPLNAQERLQGVLDQLAGAKKPVERVEGKSYGKYRLHRIYTDVPEGEQKAKENAVDALAQLSKEKQVCLIGLWEYNPPMILSAVKDKARARADKGEIHIVAFDENPATLDGIADGLIHGTVVQDPYKFGYEAVRMMAAIARGDRSKIPADGLYFVPHRVITKDGGKDRIAVDKFREDLDRLLNKKS
jgi:ribose transport system substrate-binding protein